MAAAAGTKVVVLSLASASERRRRFAERAADAGIDWQFFDAHTGPSPDLAYDEAAAALHHGRPLLPGELGCYSSHVAIWKAFLATGDEQIIVLEDDVIVDWAGLRIVADGDFAGKDYDFVRLYAMKPSRFRMVERNYLRHSLYLVQYYERVYGTQGYIITRRAAARFVERFARVVRPIDDQMDRYYENGVKSFGLFPFLLVEESRESEIGLARFASPASAWSAETLALFRADRRRESRAYRAMLVRDRVRRSLRRIGLAR